MSAVSAPRPPRTSILAVLSLLLATLFFPVGTAAFFAAGCTRGCESGGAVYVRPGDELPTEVGPTAARLAFLFTAGPELFAFLLAYFTRRRLKRSARPVGGADVAALAMVIALLALCAFVPAFACGGVISSP